MILSLVLLRGETSLEPTFSLTPSSFVLSLLVLSKYVHLFLKRFDVVLIEFFLVFRFEAPLKITMSEPFVSTPLRPSVRPSVLLGVPS